MTYHRDHYIPIPKEDKLCKKCSTPFKGNKITIFCSKDCRHTYWVENNREKLNKTVRAYRKRRYEQDGEWLDTSPAAAKLKQWMIEIKAKPCTDCGNCFPTCCMDFDHVNGVKEYNIGSMFAHHYSEDLIRQELSKCELVCSNCHRIRTRNRRLGSGTGGNINKGTK